MAYLPQRDPTDVIGRRIVAFIIDTILLDAIAVAVLAGSKSSSYTHAPDNACTILRAQSSKSISCVQLGSHIYTWEDSRIALAIGVTLLAAVLNLVVLQGSTGASVGKMMLGLRVVDAQGRVCGIGRAIVRWIVGFVDLLCAGLVGLVTVLVTRPHRRIGDMAGGTYVIATADVGAPIVTAVGAQAPAYAYSGAGWTPPAPGAQPWGAPPAQGPWAASPAPPQLQQPSGWPPQATPQPQPQSPAWGAPAEQAPPPPAPPVAPPSWGAPPTPTPAPEQSAPQPQGETWSDKDADDEEPKQ